VGLQTTDSPHTAQQTVPGPGRPYTGTRGAPRGIREAQSNPRVQALESERPVRAARRGVEGELHRVQRLAAAQAGLPSHSPTRVVLEQVPERRRDLSEEGL
jgi:hypothetical protein